MPATTRLAALCCLLALPAAAQAPEAPPASSAARRDLEVEHVTAPVELDGATLFRVRGTFSFPAEERARRIAERILEVARTPQVAPESVHVVPADDIASVMAGDRLLVGVTDPDGELEGVDRALLARTYADRIQRALRDYRHAREPAVILRGVRRAGLASAGFLAALIALLWLLRKLHARVTRRYEERISSVQFQSFEIVRAQHIRHAARALTSFIRTAAVIVLAYVWLQLVLSSFPATRALAGRLLQLVLAPLARLGSGLLAELPDLVFLLVLFLLVRWLIGLTRLFFEAVEKGQVALAHFEKEWSLPTYRVVRLGIIAAALVIAYPYIPGSRSAAFQGISIFLGVMLSIGSSSFLANIIAGYSMIYRRAFRVGDRIGVDDIVGDVTEIRLQVTHVRTVKNEEVVIPNSHLLGSSVVNYSALARSHGLILHTTVGIGYETPWRQVEAMLLLAAERTEGRGEKPAPYVLQKSLGDFCVTYEINVGCDDASAMARLYTRLHQSVLDVFNEYGVQIMTPAYEGDPEQPKVVPRDQWWTAPAKQREGST